MQSDRSQMAIDRLVREAREIVAMAEDLRDHGLRAEAFTFGLAAAQRLRAARVPGSVMFGSVGCVGISEGFTPKSRFVEECAPMSDRSDTTLTVALVQDEEARVKTILREPGLLTVRGRRLNYARLDALIRLREILEKD